WRCHASDSESAGRGPGARAGVVSPTGPVALSCASRSRCAARGLWRRGSLVSRLHHWVWERAWLPPFHGAVAASAENSGQFVHHRPHAESHAQSSHMTLVPRGWLFTLTGRAPGLGALLTHASSRGPGGICPHWYTTKVAHQGRNFQIPPDLVVKWQTIDIANVILSLIWRRHLVHAEGRNRKSRCEALSPSAAHRFTT